VFLVAAESKPVTILRSIRLVSLIILVIIVNTITTQFFVVLFNDMLVFGKTGAKLKKAKGQVIVSICLVVVVLVSIQNFIFNQLFVPFDPSSSSERHATQATVIQLTDEEALEECEREHKYLGRVMLQVRMMMITMMMNLTT
jgi:hypothetical protein